MLLATVVSMNTLTETQNRVLWGDPVILTRPTLETLKKHGQIVTVEGAKYAVNQDRDRTTLHRVALV